MKFKTILLLLFTLIGFSGFAQKKVVVLKSELNVDNTIFTISYKLSGTSEFEKYSTTLWLSKDNGKTFTGPLKGVSGDIGTLNSANINHTKKVEWNIYSDVESLEGEIVFEVRLESEKIPVETKTIILYTFTPSALVGITYAKIGVHGYYGRLKTNLGFRGHDYEATQNGISNYSGNGYWILGSEAKKNRLAITAGGLFRINEKVFLLAGAGYGSRKLLWDYTSFTDSDQEEKTGFAKVTSNSYSGVEIETGVLYFLKPNIPVSIGINTTNFGFTEFNFSVGYKL